MNPYQSPTPIEEESPRWLKLLLIALREAFGFTLSHVDSTNIWPVLAGEAKRESHPLYGVAPGYNARAVRDGDWKLIVHGKQEPAKVELFNLSSDPNETTNLVLQMPDRVAALQRTLAEFARVDRE